MPTRQSFGDLLQPALEQARKMVAQLADKAGGDATATDPEVSRLAIDRWISDTQILIELSEALAKDGRIDHA